MKPINQSLIPCPSREFRLHLRNHQHSQVRLETTHPNPHDLANIGLGRIGPEGFWACAESASKCREHLLACGSSPGEKQQKLFGRCCLLMKRARSSNSSDQRHGQGTLRLGTLFEAISQTIYSFNEIIGSSYFFQLLSQAFNQRLHGVFFRGFVSRPQILYNFCAT